MIKISQSYLSTNLYLSPHWHSRLPWYLLMALVSGVGTLLIHLFLPDQLSMAQLLIHAAKEALGYTLALVVADALLHGFSQGFKKLSVGKAWFILLFTSQLGFFVLYGLGEWLPFFMPREEDRAGLSAGQMYTKLLPITLILCAIWIEHLRRVTLWQQKTPVNIKSPNAPSATMEPAANLCMVEGMAEPIDSEQLLAVQADENYCHFYSLGNHKVMHRVTLKAVRETLPHNFVVTHRSWLVNLDHVSAINKNGRQGEVLLSGLSAVVPVSRGCFAQVLLRMQDNQR